MTAETVRAHRFALDPTPAQTTVLEHYANAARCGYNFALGDGAAPEAVREAHCRAASGGHHGLVPVDPVTVRPAEHLLRRQERPRRQRHQQGHDLRRHRPHRLLTVGLRGLGRDLLHPAPP
ncbi:helix-turn-helix domain-containing protein [Streptomyces sp. GS7]|nr:helix-turn-helix domain-containing protein [Streptomyces sp. GS7]